ncbi:hypothetical protein BKA67DRAFT_86259 [Truncatella angustata]|uniref:Uncharacterized protein n=1 Tax=Truncatella angustata TaxID=152316 RepID=A0A9P8UC63_9PEZI|nr:uncharacterized protein BKA67DRAFT_86259 [Truncatella angustata]KAH6645800.1 hypothetical protein BKA67DRAFT_86259 [Truncatella angustata]KAH8195607.1 hypothetical protein TruAng_010237 [Truncatella angustata]
MASLSSIPRFLLPQSGAIWRTTARAAPFARPLNAELSRVLVRYASKTAATSKTVATNKFGAPKAASTKASPVKPALAKTVPAKPATAKAPATKPALKPSSIPDPSKPIVLEKPERFNPPSHGARLPRGTPRHYGGAPTFEEVQAQKTKEYPGLPPPPNTWSHWFINNRHIHMFITLGTLLSLAAYTSAANFNANSPFADQIPPFSEFYSHPIDYIGTCFHVFKLHEEHISAVTAEKRRRKVEDVAKRSEYRKAHGLDSAQGIESWMGSSKPSATAPAVAVGDAAIPVTAPVDGQAPAQQGFDSDVNVAEEGKRKKFLGIF